MLFCFAVYDVSANSIYANKIKKGLLLIGCAWLVFHDGFRWQIGSDWDKYYTFFNFCLTDNPEELEPGYVLINQFVREFTDNYSYFLVLFALIEYSSLFIFIRKFSPYKLLSLFLFYGLFFGYMGMNRQFLAVFACCLSVPFIIKKQKWPYILMMLIAFTFHKSSILFWPAYFLTYKINRKAIIALISLAIIVSTTGVINLLPEKLFYSLGGDYIGMKATAYIDGQSFFYDPMNFLEGLLKRAFWLVLFLYPYEKLNKLKGFTLVFNIYLVGILVYIMFNGTLFQIIIDRGLVYYNIFEILAIPYLFIVYKREKVVLMLITGVYTAYTMYKGIQSYIELMGVDIFNPYKSILF